MTVKIEFDRLQSKSSKTPYQHIHGKLKVEIHGRTLPHMGYWGADDVCFNLWIEVFAGIRKAVQERKPAYRFDEYEQGQSAFLFEIKPASRISLSIVKSDSGEGFNDPKWQQVVFDYADFKAALLDFKSRFLAYIAEIAPQQSAYWEAKF